MISAASAITAAAIAFAGATTAVVAGLRAGHEHRTEAAPASPAPDAYVPCHTTVCGHMSTPHDRAPAGLTCRHCGSTNPAGTA